MREAIGGAGLFQIVIVLILLFTAYFCFSINYTAAFKVTDSVSNRIKLDEGINPANISETLREAHYTAYGRCNKGSNDEGWTPMAISGSGTDYQIMDTNTNKANYCLKKVLVTDKNGEVPAVYYYRIKVFYNIDVPILSSFNFNVQADTINIYNPKEQADKGYITLPLAKDSI